MPNQFKVCIVLNKPVVYSETFIKAHIDHLQAKVYYATDLPSASVVLKRRGWTGQLRSFLKTAYTGATNRVKERQLFSFWQQHKIDLVLAEYGGVGVGILPYCRKKNLPLVVHFHGYDAYRTTYLEKYKQDYSELFAYASAIIVVSKDMQEQIIRLGAPASKVFYNVYGVELDKFKRADVAQSQRQLFAAGRFVEKKAPYLTILAFQKVLEKMPDSRLVFAGEGELLDVCKKMVDSLRLSHAVSFCGSLPHEEISELMQRSRAFVQHSIVPASGDSEGTPNTILEAQASALPVVSTRHAGIKDVIVHERTGYLVAEGDIDTMASYMIDLLEHAGKAAMLGDAGRANVEARYSMESSIRNLRDILKSSLNRTVNFGA